MSKNPHPTPESLLDEMVGFSARVLNDMAHATVITRRENAVDLRTLSVYCVEPGVLPKSVSDDLKKKCLLLEQGPYRASHAAVVNAFVTVLQDVLTQAGLHDTRAQKEFDDFTSNDFVLGFSHEDKALVSVSISSGAYADELKDALLGITPHKLTEICYNALLDDFSRAETWRKEAEFQKAVMEALDRNPAGMIIPQQPASALPRSKMN